MREKEKDKENEKQDGGLLPCGLSSSIFGCNNSNPTPNLIQNVIQATSFSSRADKFQWAVDILYSYGHPCPAMKMENAPFNFYQPFLKPSKTRAPSALQGITWVSDKIK